MTNNNQYECADCGATLKHSSPCFILKHSKSKKHMKSITKPIEVIDLGYKIEYPKVYGRAEIIEVEPK